MTKRIVQKHHITYNPPKTVIIYKGEHKILSMMEWYERKTVSKGFIEALKLWIKENESRSVDLGEK